MGAAQDGNARAYEQLLREILPFLRTIALRYLRDATEAEDAVQDTLLTLHRVRATYDVARPFTSWMAAIAERRSLDRVRRRARRSGRELPLDAASHVIGRSTTEIEATLVRRELDTAVKDLPPSQATAVRLAKIEELSLAEASARSGLTVSALKVATHRALLTLRKRFGAQEGPTKT